MLRKRITLLTRRSGTSTAEFRTHWAGRHAELIVRLPGIGRYVQNHVVESVYGEGAVAPVDGVVELWFETDDGANGIARHNSAEQLADEIGFLEGLVAIQSTNPATAEAAGEEGSAAWREDAVQLIVWPDGDTAPGPRITALAAVIATVTGTMTGTDAVPRTQLRDVVAAPVRRTALPLELPAPEALLTVGAADADAARRLLGALAAGAEAAGIAAVSLHRVERIPVLP